MFFSSRRHNAAVNKAAALFPIRVSEERRGMRVHPWQISPLWDKSPASGESYWRARLEPGMVNAQPAAVTMAYGDAPPEARERIRTEQAAAGKTAPSATDTFDVFLDEGAMVRLHWRRVGDGAEPERINADAAAGNLTGTFEPVPDFFKTLGVREANPNLLAGNDPQAGQRYLAASDVVLFQPRVALTNNVTVGAAVDGVIVSVNPGFLTPPDRTPRVSSYAKFSPPPASFDANDIFFNRFSDPEGDTALLATVYALSPADADPSAQPDAGWAIFPKYFCHWNLAHATRAPEPRTEFTALTFFTALAGGVADFLMNSFLATNNDFSQAALDFYRQRRLGGSFWAV